MMYLLDLHWRRRTPESGRPDSGTSTFAVRAVSLRAAKTKARLKFNNQSGKYLDLTGIHQNQDPSAIHQ